jgi:hypothetical protein
MGQQAWEGGGLVELRYSHPRHADRSPTLHGYGTSTYRYTINLPSFLQCCGTGAVTC